MNRSSESCTRRDFVKVFGFGTAISTLAGGLWRGVLMAEGQPVGAGGSAVLKIRLSDYPALQQNGGSVRLGVNPVSGGFSSFPLGDYYPIAINRADDGSLFVVDTRCTHANCVVEAYSPSFQGMYCFCHGSRYNYDGSVINGPATQSLDTHAFEFDGEDTLTIDMVNLTFSVTATVLSGPDGRLSLTFPTANGASYELKHRQKVQDPWVVVPFATSSGGSMNQTLIGGSGQPKTIYVDRANAIGLYAVAFKLSQL
jgi:Rieske Fe-S protein